MLKRENIVKYQHEIILFFILVGAIAVWSYEITLPYVKMWEGGYQEIIARNHIQYGFENTRFLLAMSNVNDHFIYRFNHPPLFQVYVALSFMTFGIHEWSARIVPILFSVAGVILVYVIASKIYSKRIGVVSSILAAFIPIASYFGRNVNFESCVLFFGLLTVYLYIRINESPSKLNKLIFIFIVIHGVLSDWPYMILLGVVIVYSLFFDDRINNKKNCLVAFFISMMILGVYFLINIEVNGAIELFGRISQRSEMGNYLLNLKFYDAMGQRVVKFITIPIAIASIMGITSSISERFDDNLHKRYEHGYLYIFLLWGLLYVILLPQSAFVHDSALYYMIPGVAISAALFIDAIYDIQLKNIPIGKYVMVFLILIMVVPALNQTYEFHQGKSFNSYNVGLFIKNNTSPNDLVAVDSTIIAYYSDRQFVGVPAAPQSATIINQTRPKIVEFRDSGDEKFKDEYTSYLLSSNYKLIYQDFGWQVWKLDENDIDEYIYYDFVDLFDSAEISYKFADESYEQKYIKRLYYRIDDRTLSSIFQHPMTNEPMFIRYKIKIPDNSSLNFSIAHPINRGDGVVFEIYLNDSMDNNKIFSEYVGGNNNSPDNLWNDFEIPLDGYSGKNVTISFATSPGPRNDTSYDGAYWGNPKIVVKMLNNN